MEASGIKPDLKTSFEEFQKSYPKVVERASQVADYRFHALGALLLAFAAKRLSHRPWKGLMTGAVALPSLIALDLLLSRPPRPLNAIEKAIRSSKKEQRKRAKRQSVVQTLKKRLGITEADKVPDDGRCIFHAIAKIADDEISGDQLCENVLQWVGKNPEQKMLLCAQLDVNHDVFKKRAAPESDDEKFKAYCEAMGKKPYPFAEAEILMPLAYVCQRPIRVYHALGLSELPKNLKDPSVSALYMPNGYSGSEIELFSDDKHYWPVLHRGNK